MHGLARLRSSKGQMALFVALIFQALFVFFSMIINIGLVVHDKIVLQNSVDLAAYYGAQRQAELLNHIGHINFQIRQANKLLAFRYWVIGSMGYNYHPAVTAPPSLQEDLEDYMFFPNDAKCGNAPAGKPCFDPSNKKVWSIKDNPMTSGNPQNIYSSAKDFVPSVCINHAGFKDFNGTTTYCKNYEFDVPNIPAFQSSIGVFDDTLVAAINTARATFTDICQQMGSRNWLYAAKIFSIYKYDIFKRRQMIDSLANNLVLEGDKLNDIRGESVKLGIQKTIEKNLPSGSTLGDVEFVNSTSLCGGKETLLHANEIVPDIWWSDFEAPGSGSSTTGSPASACVARVKNLMNAGADGEPMYANDPINKGVYNPSLRQFILNNSDKLMAPISGYEKNPWCVVYSGVKATMTSRKPFAPFGEPIQITAEAIAQPFGSSIGPWTYNQWANKSDKSFGPFTSRTDSLLPPRIGDAGGSVLPKPINFSRYPGDQLGMSSRAALGAFKELFNGLEINLTWLSHLDKLSEFSTHGDALMYSADGTANRLRAIELAAIAPDFYDLTYFNIEADYWGNYLHYSKPGFVKNFQPVGDYGSHIDDVFTVGRSAGPHQIAQAFEAAGANPASNSWLVTKVPDLLASWAPSGSYKYEFPTATFQKCKSPASSAAGLAEKDKFNPGDCVLGGRNGYSVKLVNKNYLNSTDLELGGAGMTGAILNPPQKSGF